MPNCAQCQSEISEQTTGWGGSWTATTAPVEGGKSFCNNTCRAEFVYSEADAKGKTALRRLVTALHLLSEEDVLALNPVLATMPELKTTITSLRSEAMTVLEQFGEAGWEIEAQEVAERLSETI
jgi:hypothetical protein